MEDSERNSIKVMLVGDPSAGKTCLLSRYFKKNRYKSEGVKLNQSNEFLFENKVRDSKKIKFSYCCISGVINNSKSLSFTFKKSNIALLVFDVKSKEYLQQISEWNRIINENTNSPVIKLIIGNKYDLLIEQNEKKQLEEEIQKMVNEINAENYYFTSAQNNIGIEALFEEVIDIGFSLIFDNGNYGRKTKHEIKDNDKRIIKKNINCFCY